jgi:SAM-dependent methyltransferase
MHSYRKPGILCPACQTGQLEANTASQAHCTGCSAVYPIRSGVIDLLPESGPKRSLSQVFLEWRPFIRIYEGRFWRKSPLLKGLLGISFERETEVILHVLDLQGNEILLDLACGPGIHTRSLAHRLKHGSVVGLDLSLPMLNYASGRIQREGIDNIWLIHQDASQLPFAENEFDAVNCCGAIHLFADLTCALGEIKRVLKPGGRFIAFTFRKQAGRYAALLASLCQRLSGVNAFGPDELALHLKNAGLKDIRCRHARGIGLLMSAFKPA